MTYKDVLLEEEEILSMVKSSSIDLSYCFVITEDSIFDKTAAHKSKNSTIQQKTKEDQQIN